MDFLTFLHQQRQTNPKVLNNPAALARAAEAANVPPPTSQELQTITPRPQVAPPAEAALSNAWQDAAATPTNPVVPQSNAWAVPTGPNITGEGWTDITGAQPRNTPANPARVEREAPADPWLGLREQDVPNGQPQQPNAMQRMAQTLKGVQAPAAPAARPVGTPSVPVPRNTLQTGNIEQLLALLRSATPQMQRQLPATLAQAYGGR